MISSWTALLLVQLSTVLGLLAFHVHAENINTTMLDGNNNKMTTEDFWTRLVNGPSHFTNLDGVLFCVLILIGMQILGHVGLKTGAIIKTGDIPVRGKHLDVLTPKDKLFIGISKVQTGPFVYLYLKYCFVEPNILWHPSQISLWNVFFPLPVYFIVFDFFYTILHWFLHIKALYGYVHKHHHTQKAPSRANDDAVNVHPLEFFLGEYNHMWSMYLCCHVLGLQVHMLGVVLYLVVGGILAGWNHTRYDITVPVLGINIFDSKAHDVHHRIPQSNYGQYTMFWDFIFGSYRRYDPKDRVNPKAQLDPKTNMSYEYAMSTKSQ